LRIVTHLFESCSSFSFRQHSNERTLCFNTLRIYNVRSVRQLQFKSVSKFNKSVPLHTIRSIEYVQDLQSVPFNFSTASNAVLILRRLEYKVPCFDVTNYWSTEFQNFITTHAFLSHWAHAARLQLSNRIPRVFKRTFIRNFVWISLCQPNTSTPSAYRGSC